MVIRFEVNIYCLLALYNSVILFSKNKEKTLKHVLFEYYGTELKLEYV